MGQMMSDISDFIRGLRQRFPALAESFIDNGDETFSVVLGDKTYVIESSVGSGGQAHVFKCRDQSGAPIAMKMAREVPDTEECGRFKREFVVLKYFRHPSLVRVIEFGTFGVTNVPWMTMEFLEGVSLRAWLRNHPVQTTGDVVFAVETVIQIAITLAALHEMNVIHRDVKPENIIVRSQAGQPGLFTLVDFGLCHAEGTECLTDPMKLAAGTGEYMPMEQWEGEHLNNIDQFSLGVTLYEWLTGQRPYSVGKVPTDVRRDSHVRPQLAHMLNKCVPHHVAVVLDRMLEKNETRRFATMRDAAVELGISVQRTTMPLKSRPELSPSIIAAIELVGVARRQAAYFRKKIAPLLVDHFDEVKQRQMNHRFELTLRIRVARSDCDRLSKLFVMLHDSLNHEEVSPEWIRSEDAANAVHTSFNVIQTLNGFSEDLKSLSRLEWLLDVAKKLKCQPEQFEVLLSTWAKTWGIKRSTRTADRSTIEITYGPTIPQFAKLLASPIFTDYINSLTLEPSRSELNDGAVQGILSRRRLEQILDPLEAIIAESESVLTALAHMDDAILRFDVEVRRVNPTPKRWWH